MSFLLLASPSGWKTKFRSWWKSAKWTSTVMAKTASSKSKSGSNLWRILFQVHKEQFYFGVQAWLDILCKRSYMYQIYHIFNNHHPQTLQNSRLLEQVLIRVLKDILEYVSKTNFCTEKWIQCQASTKVIMLSL